MSNLNLDQIRMAIGLNNPPAQPIQKQAVAMGAFDPIATELIEVVSQDTLSNFLDGLHKQGAHVPPQVITFVKSAEAHGYSEEQILRLLESKLR